MKEYKLPAELFCLDKNGEVFYDRQTEQEIKNKVECFFEERGVNSKVCKIVFGPTVVTIGITIDGKFLPYQYYDLAKVFAKEFCLNGVRISYDYSDNLLYMEIQNAKRASVDLGKILSEEELNEDTSDNNQLKVALGKDYLNRTAFCDLLHTPTVFIGGIAGTGKSVLLNAMLLSLLYKTSPSDLKLLLLSPNATSFSEYEGLPHMIGEKPVIGVETCLLTLKQVYDAIDYRYALFLKNSVRNVKEYDLLQKDEKDKMYKIVVAIDDFSDLTRAKKLQTETTLLSILPKARAAGIYFIIAASNVLSAAQSNVLLTSFSGKALFNVVSAEESELVLGEDGAKNLFGHGDYLFCNGVEYRRPIRIQEPYVSIEKVAEVVKYIKKNYPKT